MNVNPPFKSFGSHWLRWDTNALDILDNNQPKNNGLNAFLKYCYKNDRIQWFDQW